MPCPAFPACNVLAEQHLKWAVGIGDNDAQAALAMQALLPTIPTERLMIETDGPYLVPRTIKCALHDSSDLTMISSAAQLCRAGQTVVIAVCAGQAKRGT